METKKNTVKKLPIHRNNKFFGVEDYNQQLAYGMEYLEEQANQTVILYEVDLSKTQVNDIYNEAKKNSIRYKTPVEIPCIYEIEDAELKTYNSKFQTGTYSKVGKLTVHVLVKHLEMLECDIKRGDYIGVQITPTQMEYFSVTDDGRVGMTANKNTMFGTTPFWRKVECAPIDEGEFNG